MGLSGTAPDEVWLQDAVGTLQEYPLDLIVWPVDNTQRHDLPPDPALLPVNRSLVAIPRHQSAALRWCNSPFAYSGGDGLREEDPTFWHLAYWMMRRHGLVSAAD